MRVAHLSLSDFRNYSNAEITFTPGANLIIGRNGQGKTNLVEAIAYFASLSSHRVSNDVALIRADADAGIARMKVAALNREVLLEIQLNRGRQNRAQLNRNAVRPRELTRWFSCVVFAPEDLMLVRGEPGVRRRFLDDALVARQPAFAGVLTDYEKVVRQRTALLKSARANGAHSSIEGTLQIWDEKLIDLGVQIMLARRHLVAALEHPLQMSYQQIVQHDHGPGLRLNESTDRPVSNHDVSRETSHAQTDLLADVSRETLMQQFEAALRDARKNEFDRAMTLIGPHRDDLIFTLNNLPVKGYASHGESWSFVLAMKLALATVLREDSSAGDPVMILDDVFAELDAARREALMTEVSKFEQVIVTAAVEEDVPAGNWNRVQIRAGTLVAGESE